MKAKKKKTEKCFYQVKLEALNDSKLIGMAIYNVLVLSVVGAVINYAIDDDMNLLYGITSGIIIVGTMLTANIIFVPKVGLKSESWFLDLVSIYRSSL